jgi:hypothetical protein
MAPWPVGLHGYSQLSHHDHVERIEHPGHFCRDRYSPVEARDHRGAALIGSSAAPIGVRRQSVAGGIRDVGGWPHDQAGLIKP